MMLRQAVNAARNSVVLLNNAARTQSSPVWTSIRAMSSAEKESLLLEHRGKGDSVAVITINRPKMNLLDAKFFVELNDTLKTVERDPKVAAIVITGNKEAFSAGSDVRELQSGTVADCIEGKVVPHYDCLAHCKRPVIAAVNGYALGGGCMVALMADIVIAGDNAKFGSPELDLGTIPSAGATQRLPRIVGKSKAMQMCLTGETLDAHQAFDAGMVLSVHPPRHLVDEAVKIGEKIASKSKIAAQICKEAINQSYEMPLSAGVKYEKRLFHITFGTEDKVEGMTAFVEKRRPKFQDK